MNQVSKNSTHLRGYSAGLDLVRFVAISTVVASHFFLNTGFKQAPFEGVSMFIQGMGQTLFAVNVALFMMLTGYLNLKKEVCGAYYRTGRRVMLSYLLISLLTIAFRVLYLGETESALGWGMKVTGFSAIPYAWYIEMWIGLFLLTPFLNVLWRNLASRRHRQVLIATLFFLTAPADLLNRYGLTLAPAYWEQACCPLMFFFVGAYIKEYQPQVKRRWLLGAALMICLINPMVTLLAGGGHTYIQITGDTNGLFIAPLAVMVFLLLYRTDVRSGALRRVLRKVSVLSLDMYLFSWMFDALYYPLFKAHFYQSQSQFGLLFFVIVPLVLLSSFTLSWVKEKLIRL